MAWTTDQLLAIEHNGSDILVSAGAGSGKTAVLTERIARLALGGTDISSILVVTFTHSAAYEMKSRISKALQTAADDGSSAAARQLALLPLCSISTLHTFCQDVIRRNFQAAGCDPSFRIASGEDSGVLKKIAMEEALLNCFEKGGDFLAFADAFGESKIADITLGLRDFLSSLTDPKAWLDEAIASWGLDTAALASHRVCREAILMLLDDIGAPIALLEKSKSLALPYSSARAALIDDDLTQIRRLKMDLGAALSQLNTAGKDNIEIIRKVGNSLGALSFGRLVSTLNSGVDKEDPEVVETLKKSHELRKKAAALLPDANGHPLFSPDKESVMMNDSMGVLRGLTQLLSEFDALYDQAKRSKNLLDFSDLEYKAIAALSDPLVSSEYKQQFEYIFIDEYQDTNSVQEKIVSLISRGNNVFCVGDVKQSIYGFRNADSAIFSKMQRRFSVSDGGELVSLNDNFRSSPNILNCVNDVFLRHFGSDYLGAMLRSGAREEAGADVVVTILDVPPTNEFDAQDDDATTTKVEWEARLIAKQIHERMQRPLVLGDGSRQPRYRDFAILMRSVKKSGDAFARALASFGVPVYVEATSGYFDAIEVNVLLNFLRICDNRRQDIPMLSVLSALYGKLFLASLREVSPEGSVLDALTTLSGSAHASAGVAAGFIELLKKAKPLSLAMQLPYFIEWIIRESNYMDFVLLCGSEESCAGNIARFIEYAAGYEKYYARSLSGFISHMDKLSEQEISSESSTGRDCVTITTIHKSKGLEYPIVFLPLLGKKLFTQISKEPLVTHRDLGVGVKHIFRDTRVIADSLFHKAIIQRQMKDEEAEELRVLYVAMTRACEELYLSAACDLSNLVLSSVKPKALMDFVTAAVLDDDGKIRDTLNGNWRLQLEDARSLVSGAAQKSSLVEPWLSEIQGGEYIEPEGYSFSYKKALPYLKLSVSGLASNEEHDYELEEKPKFLQDQSMSAAEKGTSLHFVLEHIDIGADLSPDGVKEQIQLMVEREQLTQAQAAVIDCSQVSGFFSSSIGTRMKKSDCVLREQPFRLFMESEDIKPESGEFCETMLQGIIDACFIEDGKWVLVDYKSDYVAGNADEDYALAALKYKKSIDLYTRALLELTGKEVSQRYIFLLRYGKAIEL